MAQGFRFPACGSSYVRQVSSFEDIPCYFGFLESRASDGDHNQTLRCFATATPAEVRTSCQLMGIQPSSPVEHTCFSYFYTDDELTLLVPGGFGEWRCWIAI